MKKLYSVVSFAIFSFFLFPFLTTAQQVPNANFEDWTGEKFDGNEQAKSWNASNVTQFGFKFNFAHKVEGHSGYAMMVQDQDVGAAGITETSPGYFSLGMPWVYIESLFKVSEATAGTYGGINWTYRPDTMSVWIKRTGPHTESENFYMLYYAWSGTAVGSSYKGKNGKCTSVSKTDEESDIRLAMNGNECKTTQSATQIAEGFWCEKKEYPNWINIKVPIYYMSNDIPEKMNIIFSASRYPEFRANSGLYAGNSLHIDDVELIYSASIQSIFFDDIPWNGFNPNTSDIQIYSLGEGATKLPKIEARRGSGIFTNALGTKVNFPGRVLGSKDMTITDGVIDKTPTVITVTSDDGKKTQTYKIQFVRAASTNAKPIDIKVNGQSILGFNPNITSYTVDLPYGTTNAPLIEVVKAEDKQTIEIKQPASLSDKASITVTAADGKTKITYSLSFKIAPLADNTLSDIQICAKENESEPDEYTSIPGFTPTQTIYSLSIPLGTKIFKVNAISAYPDKAQTIVYKAPEVLNGGTYQVSVTTPGNPIAKVYKLILKEEKSSYALLKDLQMGNGLIKDFDPASAQPYYVNLPIGTTQLPEITFVKGEKNQTVTIENGGLDGTTKVIVTAAAGNQKTYKIIVSTDKSDISTLNAIFLNGQPLPDFSPDVYTYNYNLSPETDTLPTITTDNGDEYQTVTILYGGLNGITRISVTAGDGTTSIYQINFSRKLSDNVHLANILLDGNALPNFDPTRYEYEVILQQGTTSIPNVTYIPGDNLQTIVTRTSGTIGDYKITVRAQNGNSATYIIHFNIERSDIDILKMIEVDNKPLQGFDPEISDYTYTLPIGVTTIPTVKITKGDDKQKIISVLENNVQTITVTAESGSKRMYTITFIITKSQNAFLKMIYLDTDSLENFVEDKLDYTCQIQGDTIPTITVDKNLGQQVSISTPVGAGDAYIVVYPEDGPSNTYVISFTKKINENTLLEDIQLNGQHFNDFDSMTFNYTIPYDDTIPAVTGITKEGQSLQIIKRQDTVSLYVSTGINNVIYTLTFEKQPNTDCSLANILFDGMLLDNFSPSTKQYTINLPAGSDIPTVTYVKNDKRQNVLMGNLSSNHIRLSVTAPDKVTNGAYDIFFNILPYTDTKLDDIELAGIPGFEFSPEQPNYEINMTAGQEMPIPVITPKTGQTTILYAPTDTNQIILVRAQDGQTTQYNLKYKYTLSSSPYLKTIYLDGQALPAFEEDKSEYTYQLPWRTRLIPHINPVVSDIYQKIKVTYCSINDTLFIDVTSADGQNSFQYRIFFPVEKSTNTKLQTIVIDDANVDFAFNPDITNYTITLPYQTTACPQIYYEKAEPEQHIRFISKPLYDTTKIIVTAENGDSAVYKLFFTAEEAKEDNRLTMLRVRIDDNDELEQELSLKVKTQREFVVDVPFGSRSLVVEYEKAYPEQTVFVQPGGVKHPTILTVKSNKKDVHDEVYTITPNLETEDPAVLTNIKVIVVNGSDRDTIFDILPTQFSYIVPVPKKPIIRYTLKKGAEIEIIEQTSKHWKAEVTYGNRTNTYNLWYYYKNDSIPNPNFTQWEKAKYNNADKPTGWSMLADYFDECCAMSAVCWLTGNACDKSNEHLSKVEGSKVKLITEYKCNMARAVPSFITLGTISGQYNTASNFSVSGGIPFHNSPDTFKINYKQESFSNNNVIQFDLTGAEGAYSTSWTYNKNINFETQTFPLNDANMFAGEPTNLNITINSYYSFTGDLGSGKTSAEMIIDWVKFVYNSRLSSMKVDKQATEFNNNIFSITLTDPERIEMPVFSFTGEVSDQAQTITWDNDGNETIDGDFAVRSAAIRNFAENATDYTDYTLTIKRPLDTITTLKDLLIDNTTITGFDKFTRNYFIHLSSTTRHLPDIVPVPGSSLQTITTSYSETDSLYTITVTPEHGEAKTYTIRFITDLSNDVTLAAISADGITFDPEITTYTLTAETLPKIEFTKKMDGQTVDLHNGILTVTAENGSTGTYTIVCIPPEKQTTGQLDNIIFDDQDIKDFDSDQYDYEIARPSISDFQLHDESDKVIVSYDNSGISWEVIGTTDTNTYTITYPVTKCTDNTLASIYLEDVKYPGYSRFTPEYFFPTDSPLHITLNPRDVKQKIEVSEVPNLMALRNTQLVNETIKYKVIVTPEEGEPNTYYLNVVPKLNNIATLDSIALDGIVLQDFAPDKFDYEITLPVGAYKTAEPQMPSITYYPADEHATITVDKANLNETTTITVTSQDQNTTNTYSVLIKSEPSHNANLTNIIVNNLPIDRFEPGRHYYSTVVNEDAVNIQWASNDNFQNVTQYIEENQYILHVTAQDGVTSEDYVIEIYNGSVSDQPLLSDILINNLPMSDFEFELNPQLTFDPHNNLYDITLPSNTKTLPDVQALLLTNGQKIEMEKDSYTVNIHVTAANGVDKNTYKLNFIIPLSNNANLDVIYLDGDTLPNFIQTEYVYTINLPVGTKTIPEITPQKGHPNQTVSNVNIDNNTNMATISVTAEDGITTKQYKILFFFQLSEVDTLSAIYQNGDTIPNFSPSKFNYSIKLPVGTEAFPNISWDAIDEYQKVSLQEFDKANEITSNEKEIYQIHVYSESGKHNVYSLNYEILKSDVDTLQMIYVNNKKLDNFTGNDLEYSITLPASTTETPDVVFIPGDQYQNVTLSETLDTLTSKSLGKKTSITVTAQNGQVRTYTLHFPLEISNETQLSMINYGNQPLPGFVSDIYSYTIDNLDINAVDAPIVTVLKKDENQNVEIQMSDTVLFDENGWKVTIHVVAEDKIHQQDYTILFARRKSNNAKPLDLNLVDINLDQWSFDGNVFDYDFAINDDVAVPKIEVTPSEDGQIIAISEPILSPDGRHYINIVVTAPDGISQNEYTLTFSSISYLQQLYINNTLVENFTRDSLEYVIHHTPGSTTEDFFTIDDFNFILSDSNATYTAETNNNIISIIVTSPDSVNKTSYTIIQVIDPSEENRLERIFLDGDTANIIRNFDSNEEFYSYLLTEGHMAPTLGAFPLDTLSEVVINQKLVGDTSLIICTSQKGVARRYKVLFQYTSVNSNLTPVSNDVLVKVLEGGKIKVATIRKMVTFALYDISGQMKYLFNVPPCDPNEAIVYIDQNGQEKLFDVIGNSGIIVDLIPNQILFYTFFENEKKKISSGKIQVRY